MAEPQQEKIDQDNKPNQSADDSEKGGHMLNEPDIGSGEKSPGEQETDEQIRQIPQRTSEPSQGGR
jgi:hypothetical protein